MNTKSDNASTLPCMKSSYDGSHWGLSDWYPEIEAGITAALKTKMAWTTGWYSSKKEIAAAKITRLWPENTVSVEVSVSDDFDGEYSGDVEGVPANVDAIREAIDLAWDRAIQSQKDNAPYCGYALLHYRNGIAHCIDYYLVDRAGLDCPPGDNYYYWGWQESEDEGKTLRLMSGPKPSAKVAAKLADHASSFGRGLRIGAWEIKPWEND